MTGPLITAMALEAAYGVTVADARNLGDAEVELLAADANRRLAESTCGRSRRAGPPPGRGRPACRTRPGSPG